MSCPEFWLLVCNVSPASPKKKFGVRSIPELAGDSGVRAETAETGDLSLSSRVDTLEDKVGDLSGLAAGLELVRPYGCGGWVL